MSDTTAWKRLSFEERFWKHVNKESGIRMPHMRDDCWLWTGKRNRAGYGEYVIEKRRGHRRKVRAHRIAWQLTHTHQLTTQFVCHRCDNPPCVRPSHLFRGTAKTNTRDAVRRGRRPNTLGDQRGEQNNKAKLTETQVRAIRALWSSPDNPGMSALARLFHVSNGAINWVVHNKSWTYLNAEGY